MIYLYERGCVTIEQEFPMGKAPASIKVGGKKYKKILSPSTTVVPPYMQAQGQDIVDRQAAYLDSNLHRQHMEESEFNKEKNLNLKHSWDTCKRDMRKKLQSL